MNYLIVRYIQIALAVFFLSFTSTSVWAETTTDTQTKKGVEQNKESTEKSEKLKDTEQDKKSDTNLDKSKDVEKNKGNYSPPLLKNIFKNQCVEKPRKSVLKISIF